MILIADSGSTKCDWTLINGKQVIAEYTTMGFNPFYHNAEVIANGVNLNTDLVAVKDQISLIRYLGSGCSDSEKQAIVFEGLSQIFKNAEIIIEHDLLGAAYATYQGEPAITGILGTGSNACFFDGNHLVRKTPSLGFVMGDEGGGGFFGKKLVTAYCYGWLDEEVSNDFKETFPLTIPQLIHRVNSEPHANVFLASMMPFVAKHKRNSFIHNMLVAGMEEYLLTHVLPFGESQDVKINFIGSVAYYFQDELEIALKRNGLQMGEVIQKPGAKMVQYFLKYVL